MTLIARLKNRAFLVPRIQDLLMFDYEVQGIKLPEELPWTGIQE